MSYSIFAGKQRSLVFPVMCNGFLTIDYPKNVPDATTSADTTDDIPYGIWAHKGSFTFESIVTPYDINGSGAYTSNQVHISQINSKKIFPDGGVAGIADEGNAQYMFKGDRLDHRMAIFYSPTFQVFLQNVSKHNYRNPAEYKIVVKLKLGSNSIETFTSPIAIQSTTDTYVKYSSLDSFNGLDANGRTAFIKLGDSTAGSSTYTSGNINGTFVVHNSAFPVGSGATVHGVQDVFVKDGDSYIQIGTLKNLATTFLSVHVGSGPITDYTSLLNSGAEIFIQAEKDCAYVNNIFHIACSYDDTDKRINIFLDGSLIFTGTSSHTETFEFLRENMYIGANATGTHGGTFDANLENRGAIGHSNATTSAVTNEQFMGELHEMSFENFIKPQFSSITNLTPKYADTLFYLRFEEVDA